ncbi:hypothetical protein R6Q57_023369 [Mikania cordata]
MFMIRFILSLYIAFKLWPNGSIAVLPGNKPIVLYTRIDTKIQQVQNLAMPKNLSDPFLQEWVNYSDNLLITPPNGVKPDNFHDPTTAWKGKYGNWRVVVGGLRRGYYGAGLTSQIVQLVISRKVGLELR